MSVALMVPFGHVMAQSANTTPTGSTMATAIVLQQNDDATAIKAEDAWLVKHYPGCRKMGQALLNSHGRYYDAIKIVTASDQSKTIYFDITKSQSALIDMFKH